jgi:hypothetical protein
MRRQAARYGYYPIFRRSSPPPNAGDRAASRYERVQQLAALVAVYTRHNAYSKNEVGRFTVNVISFIDNLWMHTRIGLERFVT